VNSWRETQSPDSEFMISSRSIPIASACLPVPYSLKLELQLEEIVVPPKSPCEGVPLRDSGLREQLGVIVVAIKRTSGEMIFNPSADEWIEAGDRLIALGEPMRLKELERKVGLAQ
jgi:K+/H+ antiporter YhaU regulatory subunit KhtT